MLSIEFKFHPPANPLEPSASTTPIIIHTHRNNMSDSLLTMIQRHVSQRTNTRKRDSATHCPDWLVQLVLPPEEDPESFVPPQCVMAAPLDPRAFTSTGSRPRSGYYSLDASQPLIEALKHTVFYEFPTIEVWERFDGFLVDKEGLLTHEPKDERLETERRAKRRKLDLAAGKKAMQGLLAGYGSDGSEEDEAEGQNQNGLTALAAYDGSDSDSVAAADEDEEDAGEDDDGDEPEVPSEDAILDIIKRRQNLREWTGEVAAEDAVDWGDGFGSDEGE
jgi:hypothetical protein